MAYMIDDKGPYPNKAGEYCGNHHPNDKYARQDYLDRMRFGRPHACESGTTEEMEAKGYVGLYLKEDDPLAYLGENGREIPTPPELMEPAKAIEQGEMACCWGPHEQALIDQQLADQQHVGNHEKDPTR